MYFKRLEVIGFKSFAEKTVLDFEPGITAVVGPNGCGKSNIFDAIRWVLGEQSMKSLRGSQVEDVIFNGTEKVPGVNFAEVSLSLSNEAKILPVEYNEVTITRRIYRSGESEYLMNKTTVRLKDILGLLMGTGIGAEAYSLVEQGKIDLILSARPEDRRLIFDEAAGVTKYKSQKREALRRLDETEQNLTRILDIIQEVKRQIQTVERQANKARRYQEVWEKLKEAELQRGRGKIAELNKKRNALQEELEGRERSLEEIRCQALKKEEYLKVRQEESRGQESKISQTTSRLLNIGHAVETKRTQIKTDEERIEEQDLRIHSCQSQMQQIEERISQVGQRLAQASGIFSQLEETKARQQKQVAQSQQLLQDLTQEIEETKAAITKARKDVFDLADQQARIKNQLVELSAETMTVQARKKRLDLEKIRSAEEVTVASEKRREAEEKEALIRKKCEEVRLSIKEATSRRESMQSEIDALQLTIKESENLCLALNSQCEFLQDLKLRYEDLPSAHKGVLILQGLEPSQETGLIGRIQGFQTLDPQLVQSLQRYTLDGTQCVQIQCEIKLISLDMGKIQSKIKEIEETLGKNVQARDAKQAELDRIDALLFQEKERLHTEELALTNQAGHTKAIQEQLTRFQGEFALVLQERDEAASQLESLKVRHDALSKQLEELRVKDEALQRQIEERQNCISQDTVKREEALVVLAQANAELESLEERFAAQKTNLMTLEDSFKSEKNNLSRLQEEKTQSQTRVSSLKGEISSLHVEIKDLEEEQEKVNTEVKLAQDQLETLKTEMEAAYVELDAFRQTISETQEKASQLRLKDQEFNFTITSIRDRLQQTYKLEVEDHPSPVGEETVLAGLESQIQEYEKKLSSYGSVNLVAIEEYEELQKRFEFLTTQQNDLVQAKESLQKAIQKINATTRKLFLETFERVKVEFSNYFRYLFGGGEAELFLIDEGNVLDSGIEIVARPPGKKLQSVSLLSGGEKSLTAIALLFAVFKVKPSPFCILDEIDAALDEANVDRFNHALKEFAKTSQFILISHNKKTITSADVMYGITMEESGMSKIVSVKFAEKKPGMTVPHEETPAKEKDPASEKTSPLQDKSPALEG